jgi:hypothetical protein
VRWAFGIVLIVVAGAVAAFGIYTWGWRDDDSGDSSRARAYAETIAAQCDPHPCQVRSVTHISGDDWKVVLRNPAGGAVSCGLIQIDRFAERASGDFAGASRMQCAEQRSATTVSQPKPAPIGPEWWATDVAEGKVEHSTWASDNNLSQAIFDCIGKGASRGDELFRRFACTYEYGGTNLDQTGRIEIVATGRDSFRVVSS